MSEKPAAGDRTPATEAQLFGWLESLRNWGRWGPSEQLGTLNYIGQRERLAAIALVRTGEVVSCSQPIVYDRPPHPAAGPLKPHELSTSWQVPSHFVLRTGETSTPDKAVRVGGQDAFLIAPHGSLVTHLDSPSHTLFKGTMYNGFPASMLNAENGAEAGSVDLTKDGIVGRGVLLDVPAALGRDWLDDGEAIYPEDLEKCEARQGVRVGRGDILLVRTGYRKRNPTGPITTKPGLQAKCLPWLHEREVALVTGDTTQDMSGHHYSIGSPVHTIGMWAMGLWIIDACNTERLTEACERNRRWEFLITIAPLVLTNSTGSPVNPLAIF